ncbi:hypothetical protein SAMN06273572_11186 [Monaibacterium marinum]|uniref:Uncharacterized protein n=1 Tax=Pontivivens marinum TaxID=1690039 RepID=A0A2C9CVW9_9RHOB|nr:hypothetical protein [Monaibacterium marinum]SOH92849.1 hypothetical protein SAMN06273572_101698 [Monaibacterium marinum]SOH92851.1 hypothetical protein SAMN06273572_101700 [Monaibacterium marinum]SOH92852.1 hypothetical protein SAMN06273572_101701 [Monaibacterium marinum]SOH95506.1 hypothetical protein SAMN06273572_11186 [Monaibacterium marinum]
MTNVAKTLLATVALTAALASPVLANNSQLAASIGIPADVAQTLTQGEIATIGAIINDDENHINSYADFAR